MVINSTPANTNRIVSAPVSGKPRLLFSLIFSAMIIAASLLLAFIGGPLAIAFAATVFFSALPIAMIALIVNKLCKNSNRNVYHYRYHDDSFFYRLLSLNILMNIFSSNSHSHHNRPSSQSSNNGLASIMIAVIAVATLMFSAAVFACTLALSAIFLFGAIKNNRDPNAKEQSRHFSNFLICGAIALSIPLFCAIAYIKNPQIFHVGTADFATQIQRFFSNCTKNFTAPQFIAVAASFLLIIASIIGIVFINNKKVLHLKEIDPNATPNKDQEISEDTTIWKTTDDVRNVNEKYDTINQLKQLFQPEKEQFELLKIFSKGNNLVIENLA